MFYDPKLQIPNWQISEGCVQPLTEQRRLSWFGLVVSNRANLSDTSSPCLSGKLQQGKCYTLELYQSQPEFQVKWYSVQTNPAIIGSQRRQRSPQPCVFLTLALPMTCCLCREPVVEPAERNTDHSAVSNSWWRGLWDGGVSTSLWFLCLVFYIGLLLILKCANMCRSVCDQQLLPGQNFPFLLILCKLKFNKQINK